jgi:hypothetical protein
MTYGKTIKTFWPRRAEGYAAFRLACVVSALRHKHGLPTENCARQMFERTLGEPVELNDFRAVMAAGMAELSWADSDILRVGKKRRLI